MRIVLLTSDAPGQRALAQRLAAAQGAELTGVVVQTIAPTQAWRLLRSNPARFADKLMARALYGRDTARIAREGESRFDPAQPWAAPIITVDDVNGAEAVAFLRAAQPDLICVSGTRMIKAPVFDTNPSRGLLNLHTGLSPFYKGGPNCTLWCLANGEPQYIGATIHELDPGIDSGRLILTAQTEVLLKDDAASLVWKTVDLGIGLYVRVVEAMAAGRPVRPIVQSQIGEGRTYFTREWRARELGRALAFVSGEHLADWVAAGRPGVVRLYDGLKA